ncbi:MAG TPA: hypothetical protein VE035_08610 [Puia sp.]|nr:hypothetical protein [Puia sp.]
MRKSILILVLTVVVASVFSSCSSSRGVGSSRSGCNMSKGFVGYGSR